MTAVRYRVRRLLRVEWRANLVLVLVVAVVGAIVLTLAAGARRTASAPDRYERTFTNDYDISLEQNNGAPLTEDIAALPSVETVTAATFFFGGLVPEGGTPDDAIDGITFGGEPEAFLSRVVQGRAPDPDDPTEFVVNQQWMDETGAEVGDRFQLLTISAESAQASGFDAEPDGPSFDVTLVGVIAGAAELQDSFATALFPTRLLDDPEIGVSATQLLVGVKDSFTVDDLRADIAALPQGGDLSFGPVEVVPDAFRDAVATQTTSLIVILLITGAAGLVVVGQVAVRRARISDDQRLSLRAVGLTRAELLADAVARVLVPGAIGSVLAGVLAFGCSGWFPRGFTRVVEPDPGLRLDVVHLVGPVLLTLGLGAAVAAVLALGHRQHRARLTPLDRATGELGEAKVAMGLRFAFARHARDAGSLSTPLLGLVLIVTTLVAAVTFGKSFDALLDEPVRWGTTYDLATGQGGFESIPEAQQQAMVDDPDVDGVTLLAGSSVNIGAESLDLTGYQEIEGDLAVDLHEGALPIDDDEIVLGELAADRLGVTVGDDLDVEGPGGAATFHVVGIGVIPSNIQGGEGLGQDGLVPAAGLATVDPDVGLSTSAISLRPGADVEAARDRLSAALGGIAVGLGDAPTVIDNYDRVRAAPWQVAALLGFLLLLSLGNLIVTTLHRRGHDIAVLRSLGADRRWISRVEHWHALAVAAVVGVLSGLVGVVVGRVLFRWRVSERIGASEVDIIPLALLALGVLILFVIADVVGQIVLRRRHGSIARRLAAE